MSVEPYRLVNDKGLWYLAARHSDTLKSFAVSAIKEVIEENVSFKKDADIHEKIEHTESIWYGENIIEVLISVSACVAPKFIRRPLLPGQEIIHTSQSGDLLVISRIVHPDQIIPLMKYWMPDVEVIQPHSIRIQITKDIYQTLRRYTLENNVTS